MRTTDAVTSLPNLSIPFAVMTTLYVILGITAAWLLSKHVISSPETEQLERAEVYT